jgi:hypothetical protein
LALHHVPQVLKLFGLALLSSLVAGLPLFDICGKVSILTLFCLVLLLEGEIYLVEFILEHFVLVVEGLADFI